MPQAGMIPRAAAPTPQEIRDLLLSLPPGERGVVVTNPGVGQHKIVAIRRNSSDLIEYDYENEPEQ